MLNDVMGIINLTDDDHEFRELTANRAIASVPFAGRYRLIDFTLSNMVNAGIFNISIYIKNKFKSLQDHLGTGRDFDLDRKRQGLKIHLPYGTSSVQHKNGSDLDIFMNNLSSIDKYPQKYVLISNTHMVTNIDYEKVYAEHIANNADITIISKKLGENDYHSQFMGLDQLRIDDKNKILSIDKNIGFSENPVISLDMILIGKDILKDLVLEGNQRGDIKSFRDIVLDKVNELDFRAYFHENDVMCINSLKNYFDSSMRLLDMEKFDRLFNFENRKIFTKVKDEPSTYYGENSKVTNSIIANGCIIKGNVENCIIFRGVTIDEGTVVKNCVVMQDTVIGKKCKLNYVVLDKNVKVVDNKLLYGDRNMIFSVKKDAVID